MWVALGALSLLYVAWCSGEHHADRALRIVEKNRPERQKKWRDMERSVRRLQSENKNLRDLIKGVKR